MTEETGNNGGEGGNPPPPPAEPEVQEFDLGKLITDTVKGTVEGIFGPGEGEKPPEKEKEKPPEKEKEKPPVKVTTPPASEFEGQHQKFHQNQEHDQEHERIRARDQAPARAMGPLARLFKWDKR